MLAQNHAFKIDENVGKSKRFLIILSGVAEKNMPRNEKTRLEVGSFRESEKYRNKRESIASRKKLLLLLSQLSKLYHDSVFTSSDYFHFLCKKGVCHG